MSRMHGVRIPSESVRFKSVFLTRKVMQTYRIRKIITTLLMIISLFSLQCIPVYGETNFQHRTIKVGVLNNTTYAYQDEDGVWRGRDVECMIAIAEKAGFNLKFIDSSDDPDFMGSLDKGTYDILTDIVQTQERKEKYLFTDEAIGSGINSISVRDEDSRWDYGNIEQVSKMKIGVLSTYANNKDFRDWCTKHEITPNIIEYSNLTQMLQALSNKEIDGAVHSTPFDEENRTKYRTIMTFLPEPYYFVFRGSDVELKNAVDEALAQILSANPDYLVDLKNKYDTQFEFNNLPFSSSESEYIAAHPILKVAVIANDEPYYTSNSKGAVTGIIPDYYDLIAKKMGCEFQYVEYTNSQEATNAVSKGEVDILGMFRSGLITAYQNGISLTDRISSITHILLIKAGKNSTDINIIAMKERSLDGIRDAVTKEYPNAQLKEYVTAADCYTAMQNGEADAALMGMPSASWVINQVNSNGYSVIPISNVVSEVCAGVRSDNQTLCSIMNKCIAATKGSFSGIVTKDTLTDNDWQAVISRIPPTLIIATVSILLFLVIGLVWAMINLRKRQKERAALQNEQAEMKLQKIQVESMRANAEARNQFFANISHDMRTPLNAIMGFLNLAKKDSLTSSQRNEYLDKAEQSSSLLLDLINDTLTVSKMSSGKMVLHKEVCRTTDLVNAVVTPMKEAAEKKKISLIVDVFQMEDCYILADKLNVEKIILNLLSNAVKYTPEGGHIWYTVTGAREKEKQIDFTVTIRDDGIGISDSFIDHIFEPFAQEKRPGYETVGTGLGLSIVKQLVDLMGGTISVSSKQNKGTIFNINLSFEEADVMNQSPGSISKFRQVELSGKKVLLCEDNVMNQEIAVAILSEQGLQIDCAGNGKQALKKFQSEPEGTYQLILMDLRMPVMDGYEATRQIRALDRQDAKQIPIVAMTADAFSDDIQKCFEAGMNAHVAKPVNPQKLIETIQKQLAAGSR